MKKSKDVKKQLSEKETDPSKIPYVCDESDDDCGIVHANKMFEFLMLIHRCQGITRFELSRRCEFVSDYEFKDAISNLKHTNEIFEDAEGRFYTTNSRIISGDTVDNSMLNTRSQDVPKKVEEGKMLRNISIKEGMHYPVEFFMKKVIYNNPGLTLFELSCACNKEDDYEFNRSISYLKFRGEIYEDQYGFFYSKNEFSLFF